jgi:hypothetical protein
METEIKRFNTGDMVPVQLDGNNEYKMIKMNEPGYTIKSNVQYVVVTDSQLREAYERARLEENIRQLVKEERSKKG